MTGRRVAVAAIRLLLGAALMVPAFHSERWIPAASSLSVLDAAVAVHFVNALLGGGWGWLGGLAAELALLPTSRILSLPSAALIAAQALPGAIAHLVFSLVAPLSRRIADLRSYLALLGLGLGLGALSGVLAGRVVFGSFVHMGSEIWAIGAAMAVVLLVPPVLLAAPVLPAWLTVAAGGRPGPAGPRAAEARWHRGRGALRLAAGVAMSVGAAFAVARLGPLLPAAAGWLHLLFVVPVLWAAWVAGLRGGVAAASLAGLCFLAARVPVAAVGAAAAHHREALGVLPPLLLFPLLGALVGAAWERERELSASLAVANRQLREDLEQMVRALSAAIEAKDAYTEAHVARVADYAEEVGRRLGLGAEALTALRWASTLHDVGKIGIPEAVLHKAGPLDAVERAVVARHPEIGARILAEVPAMAAAAPLVLHHQERWDGRRDGPFPGYPAGLSGEAIPLGARIIAVVDTFDAMTTDRPYRAARPVGEALEELRRESGRQFDPRVVEAFLAVLADRPWA